MAKKKDKGETIPIESSNLKGAVYFKDKKTLVVTFHNGSVYEYSPIEEQMIAALKVAESQGTFFHTYIKSNKEITCNKQS